MSRQMLNRSDLDYHRFEAAIATWNILNGKSDAGIRNPELLLARVQDAESSPKLRAYALATASDSATQRTAGRRVSRAGVSSGTHTGNTSGTSVINDETLSLEVVRTLAGNPPAAAAILAEIAADTQRNVTLRAEAVAGLAAVAEQHTDLLLKLADDSHRAVREEALRCLRSGNTAAEQIRQLESLATKYPESADLIQAVLAPTLMAVGRPPVTDTTGMAWRLDAVQLRRCGEWSPHLSPRSAGTVFQLPSAQRSRQRGRTGLE